MNFKKIISAALLIVALAGQCSIPLRADTLNFFEHLSPKMKAKFVGGGLAFFLGAVGVCAFSGITDKPNENLSYPQPAATSTVTDSEPSTIKTIGKGIGAAICTAVACAGCYCAHEASYGR